MREMIQAAAPNRDRTIVINVMLTIPIHAPAVIVSCALLSLRLPSVIAPLLF